MRLKEASILVVDDEPMLCELFADWFAGVAGAVFTAENGARALEMLDTNKIDLIITDIRMPVLDGIGLLRKVKARGLHTPSVIFISGFTDIDPREAYELGAEALLGKPVEYHDLINAAKRTLAERNELWQTPQDLTAFPTLTGSFSSLAAALQQHRIAFGCGGFCIQTKQRLVEGPVNIRLDFQADEFVLSGQGIVRWLSIDQAGIELTYVADEARARVVRLAAHAVPFIPNGLAARSTA